MNSQVGNPNAAIRNIFVSEYYSDLVNLFESRTMPYILNAKYSMWHIEEPT